MPVNIPHDLPARATLQAENVFVMSSEQATHQDIRPLRIAIVNLMPTKIATETHLLRLLGNTPIQLEITLLHMGSHESRNTPSGHLDSFYATFDQVKEEKTRISLEIKGLESTTKSKHPIEQLEKALENSHKTLRRSESEYHQIRIQLDRSLAPTIR